MPTDMHPRLKQFCGWILSTLKKTNNLYVYKLSYESMNTKDPLSLRIVVTSEEGVEWDGEGYKESFSYIHTF